MKIRIATPRVLGTLLILSLFVNVAFIEVACTEAYVRSYDKLSEFNAQPTPIAIKLESELVKEHHRADSVMRLLVAAGVRDGEWVQVRMKEAPVDDKAAIDELMREHEELRELLK